MSPDWMAAAAIAAGLQMNAGRRLLLSVLVQAREPLDNEQVWSAARVLGGRPSRATVSRFLVALARLDLVEVNLGRRGRQVFGVRREQPTVLVVRTDTGAVDVLEDPQFTRALEAFASRHGYRLCGGVAVRVRPVD